MLITTSLIFILSIFLLKFGLFLEKKNNYFFGELFAIIGMFISIFCLMWMLIMTDIVDTVELVKITPTSITKTTYTTEVVYEGDTLIFDTKYSYDILDSTETLYKVISRNEYSYPDPYYIAHFRNNTLEADSNLLDDEEFRKLSKNKKYRNN